MRILSAKEASSIAVRTVLPKMSYVETFGFCAESARERAKYRTELLTCPPMREVKFTCFLADALIEFGYVTRPGKSGRHTLDRQQVRYARVPRRLQGPQVNWRDAQ